MKIRVGIDPGKQGSIVIQEFPEGSNEAKIIVHQMPLIAKKEYDIHKLRELLLDLSTVEGDGRNVMVVLEDVHAIYGVGAGSTFEFGFGLGIIEGILAAYDIPYVKIAPKKWQAVCFQGVPFIPKPAKTKEKNLVQEYNDQLEGKKPRKPAVKADTKAMALVAAKRLYPTQKLNYTERQEKAQDGLVDALLMSHFCKLNYN